MVGVAGCTRELMRVRAGRDGGPSFLGEGMRKRAASKFEGQVVGMSKGSRER